MTHTSLPLAPVRSGNSCDMRKAEPVGTLVCSPKYSAHLPTAPSFSTLHGPAQLLHKLPGQWDGCTSFVLIQPFMHTWPCLYCTAGQDFPSSPIQSWVSPQPHSGQRWAAPGSTGQRLHQPLDSIPSCSHGMKSTPGHLDHLPPPPPPPPPQGSAGLGRGTESETPQPGLSKGNFPGGLSF